MRCHSVIAAGTWKALSAADRVLIDSEDRLRRRILLKTERGREVLLDLPQAVHLYEGDGLALENGDTVLVCVRPEKLLEIHAHKMNELARIAWHLGNRHLPVQFLDGCLRIRADHVIRSMVEGLGGHVDAIEAPFDPEPGAYSGETGHAHSHD